MYILEKIDNAKWEITDNRLYGGNNRVQIVYDFENDRIILEDKKDYKCTVYQIKKDLKNKQTILFDDDEI